MLSSVKASLWKVVKLINICSFITLRLKPSHKTHALDNKKEVKLVIIKNFQKNTELNWGKKYSGKLDEIAEQE